MTLILVSVVSALFLLEFITRLLPSPYPDERSVPAGQSTDVLQCDGELGWIGQPNFNGALKLTDDYQVDLRFNETGMHDTDHRLQKPANVFRILMLGDSFVHAVQVEESVTAHQILEDSLNEMFGGSPRIEVISGGVTGWGTGQQLLYYREQGRFFEPDLVLLMFFLGNDFENNLPGHGLTLQGVNCYAPYFAMCGGEINPEPLLYAPGVGDTQNECADYRRALNNIFGELYQYSRLYQKIEPLIVTNYPRQIFGETYPSPFWALYMPESDPKLKQAWQVTELMIGQLQREVEADGATLAVVFFPWGIVIDFSALSPAEQQAVLADNPIFTNIDLHQPHQRLAEFFTDQQISFLNLTEPMITHRRQNQTPLYFFGDSHWTVEGNRFVGDTLAAWLIEQGLILE